ncbi:MAG: helix-turn-helix transcriptional regulator [Bacteroidales bacterium]|nr:helix-turn-helix transcriptional regulator [Bacteroidales bacterium]
MEYRIAIIDSNSLSSIALQSILIDIIPRVEVQIYTSVQALQDNMSDEIVHYFASSNIVFNAMDFFVPLKRKTIVLCEGDGKLMQGYGFWTLNVSQPEQLLLKELLSLHHMGHPHGHSDLGFDKQETENEQIILSSREQEVLKYVVLGYFNKEIAEKLHITMATVAFHRNNISEKLGSRSLGHLTIYAVMHGIVKIDEL